MMTSTEEARYSNLEQFGFGPNVMKKNKVCPNCGLMMKAEVKICPECGKPMTEETLFDRYKGRHDCCPECDTVLSFDSQYCPNCGKKLIYPKRNGG